MGSVVLDAVNSLFPSQHPFYDAPPVREPGPRPPPPPSDHQRASPSRSSNPSSMSASAPRASSSSSSTHTSTTPQPSSSGQSDNVSRRSSTQHQTSMRTPSARPPSPPLPANTAPPSEAPQPSAAAMNALSPEARQTRPAKIKVRDLAHIQSFASQDTSAFSELGSRSRSRSRGSSSGGGSSGEETPQYEISEMKVEHIIEMVAGLLTKITTTNDQQHEHLHRQPPHLQASSSSSPAAAAAAGHSPLSPQTTSVLAFHGKNVPSITILSYLSRINKYCPTSYEVFLSLLVYFDRMTERVNAGPMQSLRQANEASLERNSNSNNSNNSQSQNQGLSTSLASATSTPTSSSSSASSSASSSSANTDEMMQDVITATTPQGTQTATPPASGEIQKADDQPRGPLPGTPHSRAFQSETSSPQQQPQMAGFDQYPYNLSHFFVVDSFNIHRLVIAGVTCASKFFSDIFYTNSRYAKVSLPPPCVLSSSDLPTKKEKARKPNPNVFLWNRSAACPSPS